MGNCKEKLEEVGFSQQLPGQKINHDQDYLKTDSVETVSFQTTQNEGKTKLGKIRQNIIGLNTNYWSPFNFELQSVYLDHTATNRPYKEVEIMLQYSKTFLANPHTQFSHYGKYATDLMHYSHESLLRSFGTTEKHYVFLPTGSGSTGAIEKAVRMLKIIQQNDRIRPDVYITPYEHHSNILPWVQFYTNVKVLPHDQDDNLLLDEIQKELTQCQNSRIIVSVSLASNVTSKLTDVAGLCNIIRKAKQSRDITFCVDCSAYSCHKALNLRQLHQIDFLFLSPHKNLGGSEACGLLGVKKQSIGLRKPTFPGGGTVNFVKGYTKDDILYSKKFFDREIPGTPPFLGYYRAALSFELLQEIGYQFTYQRQQLNKAKFIGLVQKLNQKLKKEGFDTTVEIYGGKDMSKRANVITFNFIYGLEDYVQHSFCSLIFADVFGIQIRSGCFCAGPYGQSLLKLKKQKINFIQEEVRNSIYNDKPGYLRLDLTFYLQQYEIEYIVDVFESIAKYWRNLNIYYKVCSDGSVQRQPKLQKNQKQHLFSIKQSREVADSVFVDKVKEQEKIMNRSNTLKSQLMKGIALMQNPDQFLKKSNDK